MRAKVFWIFFLISVPHCALIAQMNGYQFSHLDRSNGLSHNRINCIYKDSKGFMWFGTASGLNRYDGYNFKTYRHTSSDKSSIKDDCIINIFEGPGQNLWISTPTGNCLYNLVTEKFESDVSHWLKLLKLPDENLTKIAKDSKGNFWFIFPNQGVFKYDPLNKQTYHYSNNVTAKPALFSNDVTDISVDTQGNVWLVYNTGVFEMLDVKLNKITYHNLSLRDMRIAKTINYKFTIDHDNDFWFYAEGVEMGIYFFNAKTNLIRHIEKNSIGPRLNANIINNVVQADNGSVWVATDHGGINVIDKKDLRITYLLNKEDDSKSLKENSVILYKDDLGIMWAGTFKEGISYYHKNTIRFPLYRHIVSNPNSIGFEDVDNFAEDRYGNLWIGTNGGGLIYFNRQSGKYTQYKNNPKSSNSLSNNIIVSLLIDHEQKLWIGTYFGGLDYFDGKTFTHYRHDDKNPATISDDRIWSLMKDSSNLLWVGTFGGGVNVLNLSTKVFEHPFKQNQIKSPLITSMYEDKQHNIWISSYSGIDVLEHQSGKILHYGHDNGSSSLISDNVNSITQDSRGFMWFATREGVSILDVKDGKFTSLTKDDGLPDNMILNILEDDRGKIWLSTSNGICRITMTEINNHYEFQFENFDETDGLQDREFNQNAALKTKKGELIFGGGHGFNIFDPANIRPNINKPKLVFTDFQLFNESVSVNEVINGHVILSKAISETQTITLHHSDNVFTVEFAALNFLNTKLKYQYMLEGFDKGWISTESNARKATYTNLDGGDYIFKVKATNLDAVSKTDYITLKIKVKPPFWKSTFAYFIYLAAVAGIVLLLRRRGIQKIKMEFSKAQEKKEIQLIIEQERKEVERMHEIDKLKTKFLTNVSHEFRTPLSLIMAPVDKMLKQTGDADQKHQLNMIRKNARRLLNLVNQLLDFRKMEVQELKLHTRTEDIIKFIKEITLSFVDIADEKGIVFLFETEVEFLGTAFDHDKIERILFNLLSNAFKFTPSGGHVSVLVDLIPGKSQDDLKFLEIKVIDTGIGMPNDKKEKIFDRFFQNDLPGSILNQGSGIGLAITKEFVHMHHGEIYVETEPERGSCFTVVLPVQPTENLESGSSLDDAPRYEINDIIEDKAVLDNITMSPGKQTVLLVDDNDDFRFYLKDNLKDIFYIIEASNGREGWKKALSMHPDIMVSDISMPEMNGKELCSKIKNDIRTSHIPIILLTALVGDEEELKGLEIGANDYITKPFNFEILISKIRNLLRLQATFKKTYTRQLDFKLLEQVVPSSDEKFVKDIIEYIEKNMLNPTLSVNELSKYMGINRNTMYKKLLLITGKSPVEYIRSLRLKKAIHLLEHSKMNIAEISYEVGFNTPHYFAKSFKDEFNILPSEFVLQHRK